jgi:hypothetical protein
LGEFSQARLGLSKGLLKLVREFVGIFVGEVSIERVAPFFVNVWPNLVKSTNSCNCRANQGLGGLLGSDEVVVRVNQDLWRFNFFNLFLISRLG